MQSVRKSGSKISLNLNVSGRNKKKVFNLNVVEELGTGGFGTVFLVEEDKTRRQFALKEIKCPSKQIYDLAVREIETMSKLDHQNIVKIVAYWYDWQTGKSNKNPHALILMEYCAGGNLNTRLDRPSSQDLDQYSKWFVQMANVLKYLASMNIVHRDWKPENILFTADGNIKVADFGLAREYVAMVRGYKSNEYSQYYMDTEAGSDWFMAPEVFRKHYTTKADVFSLGAIFYTIIERKYVNIQNKRYYVASVSNRPIGEVMFHTDSQHYPTFSTSIPIAVKELIQDMLSLDPGSRPAADEVLRRVKAIRHYAKIQGGSPTSKPDDWCPPSLALGISGIITSVIVLIIIIIIIVFSTIGNTGSCSIPNSMNQIPTPGLQPYMQPYVGGTFR